MAKFCTNCGAELPEDALTCSFCGTSLNSPEPAQTNEETPVIQDREQPEPPRKKKGKWWLIPVAAVLAIVIAGAFLWKPLLLKFSPQTYLGMASAKTAKAMAKRSEGSPLSLLNMGSDCGTMDVVLDYKDEFSGESTVKMSIASDLKAKKWAVNADLSAAGQDMDLDVYVDSDFLALRSNLIPEEDYYGLTYDTFADDLRKSAFGEMLTDSQIEQFDEIVQLFDDSIDRYSNYEELLEPYIQLIEDYVKNLKAITGSEKLELGDKQYKCDTIAYTLEQDELVDLLDEMIDKLEDDEDLKDMFLSPISSIYGEDLDASWSDMVDELRDILNAMDEETDAEGVLVYYIHSTRIVAADFDIELSEHGGDGQINVDTMLTFGKDPSKDDMILDLEVEVDEETVEFRCVSSVENKDGIYKNTLSVTGGADDDSELDIKLITKWNRENGKLSFDLASEIDGEEFNTDFSIKVLEITDGLQIAVDDLYALITDIDESFSDGNDQFDCSFTIDIKDNCSIETPEYINLDQIDEDVISDLIGNIGLGGVSEWEDEIYF